MGEDSPEGAHGGRDTLMWSMHHDPPIVERPPH